MVNEIGLYKEDRLIAGGHMTNTPTDLTFLSVVS